MFARLWWKESRQFWPFWVFLTLAAAVIQGLLLYFLGNDARQGGLGLAALAFASMYAVAVGSAAFASERETGTLGLLDILAIDRRVVWAGKASFALVTTMALALVLLAMAAMSTDQWNLQGRLFPTWQALGFGLFVVVALGWGLFWSAIMNNALTAAVVATCSAGLGLTLMVNLDDQIFIAVFNVLSGRYNPVVFSWLLQILLISSTTIASALIFARGSRPRKLRFELRSPIVVTRTATTTPAAPQLRLPSPVATVLLTVQRPVLEAKEALLLGQSPRRSWVIEARALAWQTVKEGWRSWCLLAVIGLVFLPALVFLDWDYRSRSWIFLLNTGVGLVAGANVFGLENRARTYRFLNHHGARPRLVWLVKLAVWSAGLALIWGPTAVIAAPPRRMRGSIQDWYLFWLTLLLFFAVAQLAGMVIRRGITAVVVALVLGLALLAVPQIVLVRTQMPVEAVLVVPAVLLVVTWAWSGDWLFDRPAPGRWLRLGLLLISASILVTGWYAGYRAWSISDPGPIAPPAAWIEAAASPLPAAQNAAELYLDAVRRLVGPDTSARNQEVLDLVRRAAARADCRFPRPAKPTLIDQPALLPVHALARLVSLDVKERQQHGDLAGAWDDIVVLFRMVRHFSRPNRLARYFFVMSPERMAMELAMKWALARGQTPDQLLAALAAYRDLPKITSPADAVRIEANLVENTLDLPASTIRDWLYDSRPGRRTSAALFDGATMPWERTRARRVNRLLAIAAIHAAAREPWQRPRQVDPEIDRAERSTPLLSDLLTKPMSNFLEDDRDEVARRALVQILAIRVWQLRHSGQFPDHLDQLLPEILPSLPNDPYSGRPFGYVRSSGQLVAPLSSERFAWRRTDHPSAKGSWLLYSVGSDGHDDGGTTFNEEDPDRVFRPLRFNQQLDIVFAIPPVEGG